MAQDGLLTAVLQPRPREHPPGNAAAAAAPAVYRRRRSRQRSGAEAFVSAAVAHGLTVEGGPNAFRTGN